MSYEYIGYHGTDSESVSSILTEHFRPSSSDDDWLGSGVYFFINGINDPIKLASIWAKNQAYCARTRTYKYNKYSVLQAKTTFDKHLDVRKDKDLIAYNTVRERIIEMHDANFQKDRDKKCDDCVMWNMVAKYLKLDVVIHNLYIKNKQQRIKKINSNVPNTTVMCVKKPCLIDQQTIKEVVQEEDVI